MAASPNILCQNILCRVELLGTLQVRCGEQLVTHFPRQKAARLLTYLALHPKQAHPREHLVDLFWPDLDLPAGRDSLSTTLTALRRLLGLPNVLLATHQTVGLNGEVVTTDAAQLERLMKRAEREEGRQRAQTLAETIALYRGDACAGMYDDWALRESERLHGVYAEALRGLTLALEQLGEAEEAQRTASRWVAADPYCEDAHVRLIALHARAGQGGEARAAAKKLEALWREEFGASLSPAVQSEVAALLAVDPPKAVSAPDSPPLPVPLDLFFGRERELSWLAEWLTGGSTRLATLVGPGGMGKTRLALDFAARSAGRITSHFVSLVETEDAAQILPAIVRALGLPPNPEPGPQLAAFFQSHPRILLILDNLEQLVSADDAAAQTIQSLLLAAPRLSCLCTSRLALGLRGERLLPLDPLPLPPEDQSEDQAGPDLNAYASVQLYVDRARAVRPDFHLTPENAPAVAAVCRHLDGSPLALELAASWVRLLPPRAMWDRLARHSGMISLETRRSDAPTRHHSLRAALDWSWRLLKPAEQRLLARVSVFRSGWTLEAAEAVCREPEALVLLSNLLEASLVRVTEKDGETRYGLLETVRGYTRERLEERGEWEDMRRAQAAFFRRFIARAEMTGPEQAHWYRVIEAESGNIGAVLDWLAYDPAGAEAGMEIAGGMQQFWQVRGLLTEGRERIKNALAHPNAQAQTAARASALHGAANLASRQADFTAAAALHQECLVIHRTLGSEIGTAKSLMGLGIAAFMAGDLDCAQGYYEETLALYRRLNVQSGLGDVLNDLGNLAVRRGRPADALPFYQEALAVRRRRNDAQSVANTLSNLGPLLLTLGNCVGASAALVECLHVCLALGDKRDAVFAFKGLAGLMVCLGQPARAVCLLSIEAALREILNMPRPPLREAEHQEQIAVLRREVDSDTFARSWAEGQTFTWDQAVAYALAETSIISA